jgi:predicted CXXCH cytochrome family protein
VPVVYASVAIVSRHKPYIDATGNRDKCAVCHRSATGEIMEFEEAYRVCTQCHKKIGTEHVRMHGPVAVAGLPGVKPTCKWCHTGHESHEPALLKDSAVKVCTQCHESQLLSPTPQQHTDGTSCIQCHFGHGGDAQNAHFLKPGSVPQWPATQPATRPATQPATQPWAAGRVRRPAEEAPS